MVDQEQRWAALGEAITRRMEHLAIGPSELEARSGVSRETIRPLMKGEPSPSRRSTLAKVSRALDWPPDAIARLIDGDSVDPDPTNETLAELSRRVDGMAERLDRIETALADLVRAPARRR
jgi:transcriptional regulator with XRE-family HTH domain